jgi:hypothetical protein
LVAEQIREEANLAHRDLSQIEQVSDFLFQFCYYIETTKTLLVPATSPKTPDVHAADQKSDGIVVDQKSPGLAVGQTPPVPVIDLIVDQTPGVPGANHTLEPQKPVVAVELFPGAGGREPEALQEFLPLDCVLVNDPDTRVNFRQEGCLLIGDTRKPTPPACVKKAMRTKSLLNRLAKHASRYQSAASLDLSRRFNCCHI